MSEDWSLSNVSIDIVDHDETSTLFDPNYTYSNDKYFCIRGFFFAHIVFNYFIFLSGIGCFVTRVVPPRFEWLHPWFGRIYILSMLWSTVTSTLITNTGLPLATIISFGAVMGGLTVGWMAIVVHKIHMERAATALVHERLLRRSSKDAGDDRDLNQMLQDAKAEVADSQTFKERFFSLKALHGVLFFVSWMQITGRIFASNQSGDFTCHTYPIYKPIDTAEGDYANGNLTLVPMHDPDWDRLPWSGGVVAWSMQIILGSLFGAMAVGAIWSWRAAKVAKNEEAAADGSSRRRQTDVTTGHVPHDTDGSTDVPEARFIDEERNTKTGGGSLASLPSNES